MELHAPFFFFASAPVPVGIEVRSARSRRTEAVGLREHLAAQRDATGRGGPRESRAPGDSLEGSGFLDLVCQS